MQNSYIKVKTLLAIAVTGLIAFIILLDGWFAVSNGYVTVKHRFGTPLSLHLPGEIHFKIPFLDSTQTFDTRTQRNKETMQISIGDMVVKSQVSINWDINPTSVMQMFREFGSRERFEQIVLDTKFSEAVKAITPAYSSMTAFLNNRVQVGTKIDERLSAVVPPYVNVSSAQVDDVDLPKEYQDAALRVQRARQETEQEQQTLARQALQAQQAVNTAKAEASATEARSTAEAEAIKRKADAESHALRVVGAELAKNPNLVSYELSKRWNGVGPVYSGTGAFIPTMSMPGVAVAGGR